MEMVTSLLLMTAVSVAAVHASSRQSYSAVDPSAAELAQLDEFINDVMSCHRVPGLGLTVTRGDRVVLDKGYGWATLESRTKVSSSTLFPAASATKSFTSTLLAMILQDHPKNYNFDTPLQAMLGDEFRLYDDLLTEHTTLRDVLAHKTGIPDFIMSFFCGLPANETKADTVRRLRYHKPVHKFRTNFGYNNMMYALAAHVTEVLQGGEKWEDIVEKKIFQPLGMTSTVFAQRIEDWDRLATPYVLYDGEMCPVEKRLVRLTNVIGPAGSIVSTGSDMAKWLQFHLRGGVTSSGERLLSEAAIKDIYTPEMPEAGPLTYFNLLRPQYPVGDVHVSYSRGWFTNVYRGYKRVWHAGGLRAFRTQMWMFPDQDLGIYLTLNGGKDSVNWAYIILTMFVSDLFLGETPWLNTTTVCSFPAPWGPAMPESAHPGPPLPNDPFPEQPSYYESKYGHPGFGEFTVVYNTTSNQLLFSMGELLEGILQYDSEKKAFFLNFTGHYRYAAFKIPITFYPSDGTAGPVHAHMPLYLPFSAVEPTTFYREGYGPPEPTTSVNGCPTTAYRVWVQLQAWLATNSLMLVFSSVLLGILGYAVLYIILYVY